MQVDDWPSAPYNHSPNVEIDRDALDAAREAGCRSTIAEVQRAIVAEIANMHLDANSVLTITMERDYTPAQIREIREYVLAVIPPDVWVLILPPSTITVLDVDATDRWSSEWTGNEDER